MSDDSLREVTLRLERLESQLETVASRPAVTELSAEDVAAFHRVQNAFWEDGTCGINETSPCVFRCNIFTGSKVKPLPKACDVECICGPCNLAGRGFLGGGHRFQGLGG